MAMLTTKSAGITSETANPKPVTGFDYAGQPMKPNSFYNGRPEHCAPAASDTPQTRIPAAVQVQYKRKRKPSAWTAEKRAAFAERMRQYWRERKAAPAP